MAFYRDVRWVSAPRTHTLIRDEIDESGRTVQAKRIVLAFSHSEIELDRNEALILVRDLMIELDRDPEDPSLFSLTTWNGNY
jgi:hypothetical protein